MGIKTALSDVSFMNSLFTTAERIAHDMGDPVMGAEHLVIAALERDDPDLRTALATLPLDAQRFRSAVLAVHADALNSVGLNARTSPIMETPHGLLSGTPTARKVFQDARTTARKRHTPLTATVILATAAQLEHGTTARALTRLGIDRADLETLGQ